MEIDYELALNTELETARTRISRALRPVSKLSEDTARKIVSVYTLAIEPNFIPWMIQSYCYLDEGRARSALLRNINEEINQDHPEMLKRFAKECGAVYSFENRMVASSAAADVWKLFAGGDEIKMLTVATVFENTSSIFIPYLADLGKKLGCNDFTYTNIHGEADVEHAKALHGGLLDLLKISSSDTPRQAGAVASSLIEAKSETALFLERIFRGM